MALVISTEYVDSNPPDANYPDGSFKNVSAPAATDGTPLEKAWCNDVYGLLQRLTDESAITPSGVPDTVPASDYYDSLIFIMLREAGATSIRSFNLVSNMVAATDLSVGDLAITKGYLAQGIGGAIYRIVASGTGADDGGEFINLATHQAQLIPPPIVTASQYGAVGDAIADDTTEINNLLAAFSNVLIDTNSAITGTLTVPADAVVALNNVLEFSNAVTIGVSMGARSRLLFTGAGQLQGDGATTTQNAIQISSTDNVQIIDPRISAFLLRGINIDGSDDCLISGGQITGTTQTNGQAIRIGAGVSSNNNRIIGVDCSTNKEGMAILSFGSDNLLDAVICNSCDIGGIRITGSSNKVTNSLANSSTSGPGIILDGVASNNIIAHTECNSNSTDGIAMTGGSGNKVANCILDGNGSDGISISSGNSAAQVAHCNIINNTGWGISGATLSDVVIVASHFDSNTSGDIEHTTAGNLCTGLITEENGKVTGVSVVDSLIVPISVTGTNQIQLTTNQPLWLASVSAIGASSFTLSLVICNTGALVTVGVGGAELYYHATR